ncbi:MAG: ROK family protein [Gaiellaceae bacterium]
MSPLPVIGVDLGGTKLLAGVIGERGEVLERLEYPTPLESQDALLAGLGAIVDELLAQRPAAALGVGIPSTIDQREGRVVASVNIPLGGVDLAERLRSRFGIPVVVDNDANASTWAEWVLGAGRGCRHMVMLTLGTGIGGGLVLDGRLYRGAIGSGAELGHMVVDFDGPQCGPGCPGHGHWEPVASGRAADARARMLGLGDAHELVAAAHGGEARARHELAEIGRLIGAGMATLVNVFNPEVMVVGGGFAAAGEFVLEPARAYVSREALSPAREVVRIVPAELGPDAGLVGAALLAREAAAAAG